MGLRKKPNKVGSPLAIVFRTIVSSTSPDIEVGSERGSAQERCRESFDSGSFLAHLCILCLLQPWETSEI